MSMRTLQNIEMRWAFIALLEKWAAKEDSLRIKDFCTENGLKYDDTLKRWVKEYGDVYDVYQNVKRIVYKRNKARRKEILDRELAR